MSELVDRHIDMLEMVEGIMRSLTGLQYETDQARERDDLSEGDLADVGFMEREMERLLDHHKKESKQRQESIGSNLCGRIMKRFGEGEGELKCRGKIANAVPDIKQEPIIPKKGDEDYDAIMASLGIPPELARQGAVAIHFSHMGEYLTELAANNKNAPGLLRKRAVPRVTYRSNTRKKKA